MHESGDAAMNLTAQDLTRWLESYGRAWETRDADRAASLFTPDATYRETPFADAFEGREAIRGYWSRVTADQTDIRFAFDIVSANGSIGVAAWSSRFRTISGGAAVELNGVFVLEFDGAETVRSLREWWHAQ